tara:strand:+ start:1793 stop:2299 length:507 start_codon:yes stop_codon:yes gene_type:complete
MTEQNDPFHKAAEDAIKEEVTVTEASHNDLNPSLFEESYENMKYLSEGTEVKADVNSSIKMIDDRTWALQSSPVSTSNLTEREIQIELLKEENIKLYALMDLSTADYTFEAQSHLANRSLEFGLNVRKSKYGWHREQLNTSIKSIQVGKAQNGGGRPNLQKLRELASR